MARRKVEVRREEILRATVDEVDERGIRAPGWPTSPAALGISTGLVFYHFETKDALLSQAFAYAAERDLERLDARSPRAATPLGGCAAILASYGPRRGAGWTLWIDAWATALRSPRSAGVAAAARRALEGRGGRR